MTETKSEDACPKCGGTLYQTDKNTFTGEVWREYTCRSCGNIVDVNEGVALWQVLHEDAEDTRKLSIHTAKSKKSVRLGFLTYLGIPVFILICFFNGKGEHFAMYRLWLMLILRFGFIGLILYYLWLIVRNTSLSINYKFKWFALILIFHVVAMPIYWHLHVHPSAQGP